MGPASALLDRATGGRPAGARTHLTPATTTMSPAPTAAARHTHRFWPAEAGVPFWTARTERIDSVIFGRLPISFGHSTWPGAAPALSSLPSSASLRSERRLAMCVRICARTSSRCSAKSFAMGAPMADSCT